MCYGQQSKSQTTKMMQEASRDQVSQQCLIQQAAYQNHEGATLLASGYLDRSIECLFGALDTLFLAGGLHACPLIGFAFSERSFPFEKPLLPKLLSPNDLYQCQALQQQQIAKIVTAAVNHEIDDDSSYFVYSSPFLFQPTIAATAEGGHGAAAEYAIHCTAVVLFNLALAFHQRGRLAHSRSLHRADVLYEMSLALVDRMVPYHQVSCVNLKVAATNNRAHIQFEMSEALQAKHTLQDLLHLLGASKANPPFGEVEIEKLYMNVLHMKGSTMAGAA